MDKVTAISVAVVIALVLGHLLVDRGIEGLIDRAFRCFGLTSGKGPLLARIDASGDRLAVTMENRGKHQLRLAGLQGRDRNDKCVFPRPFSGEPGLHPATDEEDRRRFAKAVLDPGEARRVFLDRSELLALDCRALAIIDTNAQVWMVEGFDAKIPS